jgi:hypothetical protein
MARRTKQRVEASDRWQKLCAEAGAVIADQLMRCETRISRAVVDLSQSQATFPTSLVFTCNADGELNLRIRSREPTLRLDPVDLKLSVASGQLGLFEGAVKKPDQKPADPAEGSGKEE